MDYMGSGKGPNESQRLAILSFLSVRVGCIMVYYWFHCSARRSVPMDKCCRTLGRSPKNSYIHIHLRPRSIVVKQFPAGCVMKGSISYPS